MTIEEFKRMLVIAISQGLPGGYFQSIFSGEESDELLGKVKSGDVGVKAFKGRSGEVVPQKGDYTAEMVGAAPAGFGLGEVAGKTVTKLDQIKEFGFYRLPSESGITPDTVSNWGGVLIGAAVSYATLIATRGPYIAVTHSLGGVWNGVWEWVNPPMYPGIEYRTTERYNGSPVYAKCLDIGSLPVKGGRIISRGSDYAPNVRLFLPNPDVFVTYYGVSNPADPYLTVENTGDLAVNNIALTPREDAHVRITRRYTKLEE